MGLRGEGGGGVGGAEAEHLLSKTKSSMTELGLPMGG